MEFRILGPLEVEDERGLVRIAGRRERALLAILLLRPGETISRERLIDALWESELPESGSGALQVYVSRLRKAIGNTVVRRGGGYALEVAQEAVDAQRFERLVAEGRAALAAGSWEQARALLLEANGLWRGQALADFAGDGFALAETARLEELRTAAHEDRLEAELRLGRHAEAVPALEALVAEHPLRERPRGQLMLALYRSGRQAEALEAYRRTRELLVGELGIEPGPELQRLERAILAHESALAGPSPRPAVSPAPLPAATTTLVGRDAELAEIAALLGRGDVRLLTLTGAGGVGKTRLALEAAWRAPLAVFVSLASVTDPRSVGPTIALALGVPRADNLASALRDVELLLVLDNLERLMDAAPELAELLAAAPHLQVLATSRARLHMTGEHELAVPPLSLEHAVALFARQARAVKPAFAPTAAVTDICIRLDGLPLAIELAAARSKVLSPDALLDRLERRLPVLVGGPRDAPERQRTLQATIDWSHDLLGIEEQVAFARLSVFAGGCTLETAERVCDVSLDLLESLVDKSLVVGDDGRFGMLETIHEDARERLAASGEADEARRRHLAWFLALALRAEPNIRGPAQAEWFERLEAEHDNLRAALGFGLEDAPRDALALAAALSRFWRVHGHLAEGRRWLEAVLAADGEDSGERAAALNGLGVIAAEQGDLVTSRAALEENLRVSRGLPDEVRSATALGNLGNLDVFEGDYDAALRLYAEAAHIWRNAGDLRGESLMTENAGNVHLFRGEIDEAELRLGEALDLARRSADSAQVGAVLRSLARLRLQAGDTAAARPLIAESLELAREVGDRHGSALSLDRAARLAVVEGDRTRAAFLLGAADAMRAAIGARRSPEEDAEYKEARSATAGAEDDYRRGLESDSEEAMALTLAI
jgi:predicted ATPase/DNA-binding SARP family transcriptional activator